MIPHGTRPLPRLQFRPPGGLAGRRRRPHNRAVPEHAPMEKSQPAAPALDLMKEIVSLSKQRGFVFQSSEIYGGLKSAYDYGPLGAELKRNIMNEWWRSMVHEREDVVGLA